MAIFIIDVVLFFICVAAGAGAGNVGLALLVWLFISVIFSLSFAKADKETGSVENRAKLKREIEQDNIEWNEWRHMYQDKKK